MKISFFYFLNLLMKISLSQDDQQSLYSETVERRRIDEAQSIQTHPLRALWARNWTSISPTSLFFSSISYQYQYHHHHHHHHHLQNDLWCTGGAGLHRNWCLLCITPERSWYSTPSTFCKLVQQFPQLLWVELFLKTFLYTSSLNAAGTVPSHDYYTYCKFFKQQGLDWIVGPGYNSGGYILGCS